MALGAQTRDVLQLVVRQGMLPVALGVGLGLICTFAIGRFITAQLYQVSPQNPLLLLSVTLILCAVALIACLVPARHAALIDPIQALRIE
jgi:ABC-type antimicrobial peptide transport system permease subunit